MAHGVVGLSSRLKQTSETVCTDGRIPDNIWEFQTAGPATEKALQIGLQ